MKMAAAVASCPANHMQTSDDEDAADELTVFQLSY